MDENGDGQLSFYEIEMGLRKLKLPEWEVIFESLKRADVSNSGSLNYTEFIAATLDSQIFLREEYLQAAFEMFDKDNSGSIDIDEISQLLQGEDIQKMYTKEAIEQVIREFDRNGDGQIDFEEFKQMMKLVADQQ